MKVWRLASGRLDAIRVGRLIVEFAVHDSWLPMYAKRLVRLGRFQVWRDEKARP